MTTHEARYRYRLRVRPDEALALKSVFDSCRFVWNQALGRWGDLWRREGLPLSYKDMDAELTDWRSRFEWLEASPSVPQQQVLRDLYKSISAFFDPLNPHGGPASRSAKTHMPQPVGRRTASKWEALGLGRPGDRLEVAIGGRRLPLRVAWSRPLPSAATSVTIRKDAVGHYWASFVVRVEIADVPCAKSGRVSGLDVGLSTFATTEDGKDAEHRRTPGSQRGAAKALARSQRSVASKKMGSKNRGRAKKRAARVAVKVANQRADFHHKAARGLLGVYDVIGVEDLRIGHDGQG